MEVDKTTKNTVRFATVEGGQPEHLADVIGLPEAVSTLYIGKHAFGGNAPKQITVSVEW